MESKNKRIQKSVKENTATIRETEDMVRRTRGARRRRKGDEHEEDEV